MPKKEPRMEAGAKFARMVAQLRCDPDARRRLLEDPETLLGDFGLERDALRSPQEGEALTRARHLLSAADIAEQDDAATGLRKLGKAARQQLGDRYVVEVDPLGITLLECGRASTSLELTASGTAKCTFSPWDGCSPDVDG